MRLTNLLSAKGATKQEEGKAVEFEEVEEEGEEKEEADMVEEGEEEGEKTAGLEVPVETVERAVVVKKKKKMEEGMLTLEVAKVHEMEVKKMSITMDNDMCIDQMVDCVQHIATVFGLLINLSKKNTQDTSTLDPWTRFVFIVMRVTGWKNKIQRSNSPIVVKAVR